MTASVYLQPALILHRRPYRESSLLIDAITRDHGVVTLVAKAVRSDKSRSAALLQPFSLLNLSFLGSGDLKTLTSVERLATFELQRLALYCGFYVNELLQRLCFPHAPCPEVFERYQHCLQALTTAADIALSLRHFELDLLEMLGYGVEFERDTANDSQVVAHKRYDYRPAYGMVEGSDGTISGATLIQLAHRQPLPEQAAHEAKHLLRQMLDQHLGGKPLKSRDVLSHIIKYL
ncbi:MAG: DNA repair protein RecO [Methylomonas sp.]|nr:DNA repair protein RecO [Methylomonas sp.]PPD21042.1 MAG: DNA repair protein RecO [Methylomonas sp.]PPD27069.1 MAG: DNA repair protein RecO [Methylomonas sp.]PPD39002.1 MAG: DNA repair protein RecO [Methylomonas sp.]PPD40878.1 MAG: DNA repair protein RecO [Methylomonas sp.]